MDTKTKKILAAELRRNINKYELFMDEDYLVFSLFIINTLINKGAEDILVNID